jgi:hypothetical protein
MAMPKRLSPSIIESIKRLYLDEKLPIGEICKRLHVSDFTVRKYTKAWKKDKRESLDFSQILMERFVSGSNKYF